MKCFYHYERDSKAVCSECQHPLCQECIIDLKGAPYCRNCLESTVAFKALQKSKTDRKIKEPLKSPATATWLSIIPGLGFIYLELYLKGIAIFIVWIGLIMILKENDLSELIGIGFWLFQLIYTNQEAKRLNRLSLTAEEKKVGKKKASLFWGVLAILFGVIFLIHNFGYDLSWIFKFWPLIVIGVGAQLVWDFFKSRQVPPEKS
jgi:hypothetical protein